MCRQARAASLHGLAFKQITQLGNALAQRPHLDPPTEGRHASSACLLNLAGGIAARLGHGLPGENQHWALRPEVLRCAKVTTVDLDECAEQAQKDFAVLQAAAPSA